MATKEELQAERDQLRTAYLSLITGAQVAEIWREGRRLTFRAGSAAALRDEYEELDRQIAALDPTIVTRPRFRGLGVNFGGRVG